MLAQAQLQYYAPVPDNTSCENALSFCSDFDFHFEAYSNYPENMPCLYFRFEVTDPMLVHITASSGNFKLHFSGPFDPRYPCPDSLQCGESGFASDTYNDTLDPGIYYIYGYSSNNCTGQVSVRVFDTELCPEEACEGCLPSFSPLPGKKYVLDAWVKKEGAPLNTISYSDVKVQVESPANTVIGTVLPIGHVIDGWQLMEGTFQMPSIPSGVMVKLLCDDGTAYFDDVRIFPADGSMKSYVYDPVNLRFMAELDERHFATIYEYDNEGKLVRTKKETERGVMTIQETRSNNSH